MKSSVVAMPSASSAGNPRSRRGRSRYPGGQSARAGSPLLKVGLALGGLERGQISGLEPDLGHAQAGPRQCCDALVGQVLAAQLGVQRQRAVGVEILSARISGQNTGTRFRLASTKWICVAPCRGPSGFPPGCAQAGSSDCRALAPYCGHTGRSRTSMGTSAISRPSGSGLDPGSPADTAMGAAPSRSAACARR